MALDGFAGMTDAALRAAVQGTAPDSRWAVRRRGGRADVNVLLALQSFDLGGGGGDSGGGDGD